MEGRKLVSAALMSGALLGWIVAGAGIPVVRSQVMADIRCIGFEGGQNRKAILHLHNAAADDTTAEIQWLDGIGTVMETISLDIPSGQTPDNVRRGASIGVAAKITSPGSGLIVDGEMIYDDNGDEEHRRTVTCARL
jgi:hypothetical protein